MRVLLQLKFPKSGNITGKKKIFFKKSVLEYFDADFHCKKEGNNFIERKVKGHVIFFTLLFSTMYIFIFTYKKWGKGGGGGGRHLKFWSSPITST